MNDKKNFLMQFGLVILTLTIISFTSVISGTIVWMLWPVAMSAFPGLVSNGIFAAKLTWWQSVCLTWLFGVLIKSSGSTSKCTKDEKMI